jgi:hypothetical protein
MWHCKDRTIVFDNDLEQHEVHVVRLNDQLWYRSSCPAPRLVATVCSPLRLLCCFW